VAVMVMGGIYILFFVWSVVVVVVGRFYSVGVQQKHKKKSPYFL